MADNKWRKEELEAAVEAYLQMLRMEMAGRPFNKAAISQTLLAGPLKGRRSTDHRMQNISHVLQTMGRRWVEGFKPLSNVGDRTIPVIRAIIEEFHSPEAIPRPLLPPVAKSADRKLPPTGYWIFVCNRNFWNCETWLNRHESELFYKISEHNKDEVQIGDVGVLRLNKREGTKRRPSRPAGVYALIEVVQTPVFMADVTSTDYADPANTNKPDWRAKLRVLANLVDNPVDAELLPDTPDFEYLRRPLQTSSIPLTRRAFIEVVSRSGVDRMDLALASQAQTADGIKKLEQIAKGLDPTRKERISRYIERGNVGTQIKEARKHRCQLCEALGLPSVAFVKGDGKPYAEAHHVQPVSLLLAGSLGERNIMVLCPNHHRQAHHGLFVVREYREADWIVSVDGRELIVPRTSLSA